MPSLKMMAKDFARAASLCAAVADKGKIPILNSVRVSARDGEGIEFVSTDTTQTIMVRAASAGSAEFCVDAGLLDSKARTLKPMAEVEIDYDGRREITITQGRSRWKMPTLSAADFPSPVMLSGYKTSQLPADFQANFAAAATCADPDREMLAGVLVDGALMVATDGHKMFVSQLDMNVETATIPTSAASKIALLEGRINLTVGNYTAIFEAGDVTLISKLGSVQYPAWRRVVPDNPHSAIVDRAEFEGALARIMAIKMDGEKSRYVHVKLTLAEDEIRIKSRNRNDEIGEDSVTASRDGPDFSLFAVGALLRETIATIPAETIRICYGTRSNPLRIEPVPCPRENFRIVMPLTIVPVGFDD